MKVLNYFFKYHEETGCKKYELFSFLTYLDMPGGAGGAATPPKGLVIEVILGLC